MGQNGEKYENAHEHLITSTPEKVGTNQVQAELFWVAKMWVVRQGDNSDFIGSETPLYPPDIRKSVPIFIYGD